MRAVIDYFEEGLCALIFLAMTGLGFANILVRYLSSRSLASTEELLINGFLLLTVLGAAIAAKRGDHLAVTVVHDLLPRGGKVALTILATALGCVLLAAAAWFTAELVANQMATGVLSYALQIPAWYYSAAVPAAFLLVMARFVQQAARAVRDLRSEGAPRSGHG